jgi:hypothetical protein
MRPPISRRSATAMKAIIRRRGRSAAASLRAGDLGAATAACSAGLLCGRVLDAARVGACRCRTTAAAGRPVIGGLAGRGLAGRGGLGGRELAHRCLSCVRHAYGDAPPIRRTHAVARTSRVGQPADCWARPRGCCRASPARCRSGHREAREAVIVRARASHPMASGRDPRPRGDEPLRNGPKESTRVGGSLLDGCILRAE